VGDTRWSPQPMGGAPSPCGRGPGAPKRCACTVGAGRRGVQGRGGLGAEGGPGGSGGGGEVDVDPERESLRGTRRTAREKSEGGTKEEGACQSRELRDPNAASPPGTARSARQGGTVGGRARGRMATARPLGPLHVAPQGVGAPCAPSS